MSKMEILCDLKAKKLANVVTGHLVSDSNFTGMFHGIEQGCIKLVSVVSRIPDKYLMVQCV